MDLDSNSDLQLFDIQPVNGKGRALVARVEIERGTQILCEKPLIRLQNASSPALMEKSIVSRLKALSKDDQRVFLSLHNNFPGKNPFSGIIKTNALPCDDGFGAVYSTICFINHSCLPNAQNCWNSDLKSETVYANRSIRAGEEITISYEVQDRVTAARIDFLKEKFGFVCSCSVCTLPLPERQASDARRKEINHLDKKIGEHGLLGSPGPNLKYCREMLRVIEEEYGDGSPGLIAKLYHDAFEICITHGDQARASVFARKSYEARVVCAGGDSPEAMKMKGLSEQPANYQYFGMSNKWKTRKGDTPKSLDAAGMENWLWRE